jgi:hypothetical protein
VLDIQCNSILTFGSRLGTKLSLSASYSYFFSLLARSISEFGTRRSVVQIYSPRLGIPIEPGIGSLKNQLAIRAVGIFSRKDGQRLDCATELHKARELAKDEFQREVSKHLTVKETEPREILNFKAYKSQLPVIEKALESAALMLGSDKSRGYCLETICADFMAGVGLEAGNTDAVVPSQTRLILGLPIPRRKQVLENVQVVFRLELAANGHAPSLNRKHTAGSVEKS